MTNEASTGPSKLIRFLHPSLGWVVKALEMGSFAKLYSAGYPLGRLAAPAGARDVLDVHDDQGWGDP